jgi:hypothetical protein
LGEVGDVPPTSTGKEEHTMKTFAAIVAVAAMLLISITTTFAAGFEGRVADENPYAYMQETK